MKLLQKYKDMPVPAKASIWYTICNIMQKGISFLVIPIYTRLLTAGEYGQYSVFQSWRDILIIFATLNLYCGVFTKAMVEYENDRKRYTSCMQGLSTLITIVTYGIYVIGQSYLNRLFEMKFSIMTLLFVYYLVYPAFSFWSVKQRVEYRYIKLIIVTIATSIITPVISIALLNLTDMREDAVIVGYLIVQIGVGLYFYIYQFIIGKCFCDKKYWTQAIKFNIPLIPHYLSLIVLGQADRIMIRNLCGSDKAGIYNLAYQVSMVMIIVIGAINNSLVPWTYEKLKEKKYTKINQVGRSICFMVATMTVGVMIIAPEVIRLLGTKEYYEAVWIIPSVAISVFFTFCYGLFSTVEFYYDATQYVMIASVVGAFLNVILNAICIPVWGYIAAGYTTAICYFTFMIMHYIFMVRICKKEGQVYKIYDTLFMVVCTIMLCIIGGICMILYNYWIIRYVLLLLGILIAFIRRKKIIGIVSEIKD